MEKEVGMETALFGGPPELGNLLKLATGQINFMTIFASPLFEGVADLMPQMWFAATQIKANKSVWQDLIEFEKRKESLHASSYGDIISPRSHSPALQPPPAHPQQADDGSEAPSLSEFPSPTQRQVGVNPPSLFPHRDSHESISRPCTSMASSMSQCRRESDASDQPYQPYPPTQIGVAARKSSSAIPGLSVMPSSSMQTSHGPSNLSHAFDFGLDADQSQEEENSQQEDFQDQDVPQINTGSHHQDSPILAAVIFASQDNSETPTANARRRSEIEDVSPYGTPACGNVPSSSNNRYYSSHAYSNHHRHQHHTSTNTSAPSTLNRNSQANSGATTQSSNTVMTPISPSTQCTSFLSPDPVDEKDYSRRGYGVRGHGYGNGYDYDSGNEDDLAYHSESRPTSAGVSSHHQMGGSMPAITSSLEPNGRNNSNNISHYSYHHHLRHQHSEDTKKIHRFTRPPTSVMGNPNGNENGNTGNDNGHGDGSNHSYGSSVVRVGSGHGSAFGSDVTSESASPTRRNVPKRRSRLRLAFWRRNKPPQQQQQPRQQQPQPHTQTNHVDDW